MPSLPLSIALASVVAAPLAQDAAPPSTSVAGPSLVRIDLEASGRTLAELRALDVDFASHRPVGPVVDVLGAADELERIRAAGFAYEVVHDDLTAFYVERAREDARTHARVAPTYGAWLTPVFGEGAMSGFYTVAELESVLDQITAAYPALTTDKFSIGTTIEGRSIWAVKISDNADVDESEPEVRFDAMHHAREPESMQATLWMMLSLLEGYGTDPLATYLVNEREMWFLPCVNPDGYAYNESIAPNGGGLWRKNRRDNGGGTFGVDLNRNYDHEWGYDDNGSSPSPSSEVYRGAAPASEPEVAAMQAFVDSRDFATAISAHTYSNLWLYPWGYDAILPVNEADYDEVSRLATAVNNYFIGPAATALYLANGVTIDYDHGVHGTMSWTCEIGGDSDGFWPVMSRIVPLAEENEVGFETTALTAGTFLRHDGLVLVDLGDGDGNLEPGETFEALVQVRNSGRVAGGGSVTLASSDPNLVLGTTSAAVGTIAPFSSGANAVALTFTVDVGATFGSRVHFSTEVEFGGYAAATDHTFAIGDASPFVVDDVEVDVGWIAGLPGDTATSGLWEFGDPVGTSYNGVPMNPEDDASASGVSCFTTGNGSTTSGGDDVDDGHTTLVTPRLDLSGVSEARISYQRWYANEGSPADDELDVSISDDDGATWTTVETVPTTAPWTEAAFFASDFVSLTDQVRLRFVAEDDPNNSLVEAAIDDLAVTVYDPLPRFNLYGRPAIGTPLAMHVAGSAGDGYVVYASPGTATISLPGVIGDILLSPTGMAKLIGGTIPGGGLARVLATIPNDAGLVGQTFYCQGATVGAGIRMTNRVAVTFE